MDLENNNRKLYQHRQHIQLVQTQKQEDSTQKKEEHIKLNPKIQQSRHSQARQSYFDLEQSVSPTRQVVVKRNKRLTKNSDQLISTCENVIEEESKGVSIQQKPKKISLSRQAKKSIVEQNSVTQKGKYKGQKNVALSSKNQKEQFNFEIIRIINEVQHEALSKNNLLSNLNLAKQLIMIQSLKKAPSKRTPDDLKAIRSILRDNKFFAVLENEERDFESDIFQTCLSYVEYQHAPLCSVLFYQGEPGEKFYIILEGIVGVYINEIDDQQNLKLKEVNSLCQGQGFGEQALEDQANRRNATIIAKTECHFAILSKKAYSKILQNKETRFFIKTIDHINELPYFVHLKRNAISNLVQNHLSEQTFDYGQIVFREGDQQPRKFFIVKKGEFKIKKLFRIDKESNPFPLMKISQNSCPIPKVLKKYIEKEVDVEILSIDSIFGEHEALEQTPRNYTVTANSQNAILMVIDVKNFLTIIDQKNLDFKQFKYDSEQTNLWRQNQIDNIYEGLKLNRNLRLENLCLKDENYEYFVQKEKKYEQEKKQQQDNKIHEQEKKLDLEKKLLQEKLEKKLELEKLEKDQEIQNNKKPNLLGKFLKDVNNQICLLKSKQDSYDSLMKNEFSSILQNIQNQDSRVELSQNNKKKSMSKKLSQFLKPILTNQISQVLNVSKRPNQSKSLEPLNNYSINQILNKSINKNNQKQDQKSLRNKSLQDVEPDFDVENNTQSKSFVLKELLDKQSKAYPNMIKNIDDIIKNQKNKIQKFQENYICQEYLLQSQKQLFKKVLEGKLADESHQNTIEKLISQTSNNILINKSLILNCLNQRNSNKIEQPQVDYNKLTPFLKKIHRQNNQQNFY